MLGFEMWIVVRSLEWGFWYGVSGMVVLAVGEGLEGRWVGGKMGCGEDGLEGRRVGGKTGLGGGGFVWGLGWEEFGEGMAFYVLGGGGSGLGGEEMELGVFGCVIGEGGGCWSCDYEGEHQGVATGSDVWVGCGMGDFAWTMKN